MSGEHVSERWARWRGDTDLDEYHLRWERLEAAGTAAHGEADLIQALVRDTGAAGPVLDAGCGMGRIAIELDSRGVAVEGIDLDEDLLSYARRDAPHLAWHLGDLAAVQLPRRYALVAMPGNVMLFCRAQDRAPIVANLAGHLDPGGLMVAGFGLERHPGAVTLHEYDAACERAGLVLHGRYATWERDPFDGGPYAVSVHRRV